ncbi:hypothetical protein ACE1ET_06815 [Saccharicrinis sp. FJH62]|uniref:hypothetical protein n=1 Tax=Saccharicrinis sp. FJH62 TaxID=3344657 RepID=UPI0035D4DF26
MKKYFLFTFVLTLLFLSSCEEKTCDCDNSSSEVPEALQGKWVRVESNNVANDGMIIKVVNDQGILLSANAALSFNAGDIKWKDIVPEGDNMYSYEELGSDDNYYPAEILLENDSTIMISVGSTGAGNEQKWVREGTGSSIGPTETVILDCNAFKSDYTLKNGPAEIDYLIDCVADVTAALTIEPGVVIAFTENSGLGVYDGGTLNAVGYADKPIVFMGYNPGKGYWRGIHLETSSVNNKLENVMISDAGSNYVYCCNNPASLFIKGGKIALNHVTITNGAETGLEASKGSVFSEYSDVTITSHDGYPAVFSPDVLSDIDGLGSDYSGNLTDYIFVYADKITSEVVWQAANVPYLLEGSVLDVTDLLTIEAGTEIRVEENGGIGVYDNGALKVTGTSDTPVTIEGKEGIPAYWRGIHMETNSLNNHLSYLNVYDAGSNYVYCCVDPAAIYFKDGKCWVDHLNVSSGSVGIYAADAFTFTEYSNVNVEAKDEPLLIAIERANELDTNSKYSSTTATKDYITFISNTDVKDPVVITNPDQSIPYLVDYVVDITAQLEIQAGVQMVFKEDGGLGVYDDGILSIIGSEGENVSLYGIQDVQGYWRGIHTETNSLNNIINYATISNAGGNYVYCCNQPTAVLVKSGKLEVTNSMIDNSGGYGLYVKGGAQLTHSGNTYANNAEGNLFEE